MGEKTFKIEHLRRRKVSSFDDGQQERLDDGKQRTVAQYVGLYATAKEVSPSGSKLASSSTRKQDSADVTVQARKKVKYIQASETEVEYPRRTRRSQSEIFFRAHRRKFF